MTGRLTTGALAPDFAFDTPWKTGLRLSDAVKQATTVLMFLRYIGCPVCQMKIAELKRDFNKFSDRGVNLLVVLQSTPENITGLIDEADMPFTIVCDPKEERFALFGVVPGTFFNYAAPGSIVGALRAVLKGFKHGKFEGNERQLPAVFIIGGGMKVKYAYYGKNVADVPSTERLLSEIDQV